MLLQRGKFLIKDIKQLDEITPNEDGIKKIIDLDYMGRFEFEGNTVPVSRMFIEYYKDEYEFIPLDIYSKDNEQLYLYFNKTLLINKDKDYLYRLAKALINRNYSLASYIEGNNKSNDFWWDLDGDYFIFFDDKKIELINYFIESCYKRDGEKNKIKEKLKKIELKKH